MTGGGRVATASDLRMDAAGSLCCEGRNQRLVIWTRTGACCVTGGMAASILGELRVALVLGDPGVIRSVRGPRVGGVGIVSPRDPGKLRSSIQDLYRTGDSYDIRDDIPSNQ